MTSETQHNLKLLAELVAEGQCVLFLGNDAPQGFPASAPPCRDELAAELARELDMPPGGGLAVVADAFESRCGRNALVRRVLEWVDKPDCVPTGLHRQIAALPFQAIITTAQDCLLEHALREAGRAYATVLTDVEVPYIEEHKVMVYKLLGCVSRPESLVLTQRDHVRLMRRLSTYLSVLRYLFAVRPLLFLNYNLRDLLFVTLFDEVTANVQGHRRQACALWPGASLELIERWRKDGLNLLLQPATDFLDELARHVSRYERALVTEQLAAAPLTKPPYKFLDYYESDDRDIFYGRQIESVRFFRLVLSHYLTVLFGASGTGKTSLIKAGVMPLLWEQGYVTVYVRALDDPLQAVRSEVLAFLRQQGRAVSASGAGTLRDFFRAALDPEDRLVVFLDQFEEFFLRLGDELRHSFWAELAAFRDQLLPTESPPSVPFDKLRAGSPTGGEVRGGSRRCALCSACARISWPRSTRPANTSPNCWAIRTGWPIFRMTKPARSSPSRPPARA